jgi:phosphonate transport system substrate-binding protein
MKRRQFVWSTLLFLGGCTLATQQTSTDSNSVSSIAKPERLNFSVTDIIGLEKLEENYGQFRAELSEVLGIELEFFPVDNMSAAASALQLDRLDFALTGPSEYVAIRARTNAIPVIAIERPNYYSAMVVPADSSIESIQDLKGKTLALSDVGSTSGHLSPTHMLVKAGLNPKSDLQVKMLGDDGSIEAIKTGQVDAWAGSAVDYKQYLAPQADRFKILAEGPPLPNDVFVASSNMNPELVEYIRSRVLDNQDRLIQALVQGEATQKYKGARLLNAQDSDYDMIREVYRAIGQGDFLDNNG